MILKIQHDDNKVQILLSPKSSMEDLKEWDILIKSILSIIKGQKLVLITLNPQSYSLGQDLGNNQKFQRGKKNYLINWNVSLSEDILYLISESEEFKRGLLYLIISTMFLILLMQ
jgi:hypothetical protein